MSVFRNNNAPIFTNTPYAVTVDRTSTSGTQIYTVTAVDADQQVQAYIVLPMNSVSLNEKSHVHFVIQMSNSNCEYDKKPLRVQIWLLIEKNNIFKIYIHFRIDSPSFFQFYVITLLFT